jgi:hypothetical protein
MTTRELQRATILLAAAVVVALLGVVVLLNTRSEADDPEPAPPPPAARVDIPEPLLRAGAEGDLRPFLDAAADDPAARVAYRVGGQVVYFDASRRGAEKPIPGARVELAVMPGGTVVARGESDGEGRFSLTARLNRDQLAGAVLRAVAHGYALHPPQPVQVELADAPPPPADRNRVRLAIDEHPVAGRVLDAAGQPVPGADVVLVATADPPPADASPFPALRATTDADGRFRFPRPVAGIGHLRASANGHAPATAPVAPTGETELRLARTDGTP